MMILQNPPEIFISHRPADAHTKECMVFTATIATQPDIGEHPWETIDWKIMGTIPSMPDATFEQIEQQARLSLVENLRAIADAIEAEQYAQPEAPD